MNDLYSKLPIVPHKSLEEVRLPADGERQKHVNPFIMEMTTSPAHCWELTVAQTEILHWYLTETDLPILIEAIPEIQAILTALIGIHTRENYNSDNAYQNIRNQINTLVGFNASDPRVRTSTHWDLLNDAICDLMPYDADITIMNDKELADYKTAVARAQHYQELLTKTPPAE